MIYVFYLKRYYKFIFPDYKLFNLKVWFVIHRPLMISTFILSFVSLFVILADKNWEWIDKRRKPEFAHALFGILTILLSFIQVN
jgi:hypothetical protein